MIDLQLAKDHLRVDGDDDAGYIGSLIDAAERAVLDYLDAEELPESPAVQAGILLLIGSLYENRESLTDRPLAENPLFIRLLRPYRAMGV